MVRLIALVTWLMVAAAMPASAQMTVLTNLEFGPAHPVGALVQVQDGIFYGVTSDGGAFAKGTVFILYRRTDGSWGTHQLLSFNGVNGARPMQGLLLGQDGNFYGTTTAEGPLGAGTVFRTTPFGVLTTLHAFPIVNGTLERPSAPLTQSADGFIWGSTCPIGPATGPTGPTSVFRMTPGGSFTTIYRSTASEYCVRSLAHADDGRLVGVNSEFLGFFIPTRGYVFNLTRTGVATVIAAFSGTPTSPVLRGTNGIFYALFGGGIPPTGLAVGFTVDGLVVLEVATGVGVPETLVEAAPGVFYGTTRNDNFTAPDTFFRLRADGQFSVIKEYPVSEDASIQHVIGVPRVSLVRGVDGLLYGLSMNGGKSLAGAAFTLDLTGNATVLSSFTSGPLAPLAKLVESGGAFYGASCSGGEFGRGTLFRVTPAGVTTVLLSFSGDVSCPADLHRGPDGHFYGLTAWGYIFKATLAGEVTILRYLAAEDTFNKVLSMDADGTLRGNARDAAGSFVFAIAPSGAFTRFDLPSSARGVGPGVAFGADGNLFGGLTVGEPGALNQQLFKMTPAGAVTPLFTFPEWQVTFGNLLPASDGNLYGSLSSLNSSIPGSIFRATVDGQVTPIHTLTADDNWNPFGALAERSNGDLAGLTFGSTGWRRGVDANFGTLFTISKSGAFRTLHRFSFVDGANPYAALLAGSDGALYGTTISGGTGGGGVVFRIQIQP